MLSPGQTSFPVPPWMHPHVFGWLLCPFAVRWPTKAMTYFISIIFCCSVWWLKQRANVAPHTFRPGRISSEIPSPPLTFSSGWLLCQIIKRQPPKANTPRISLFFDAHWFVALNKGTSHRDRKPSTGRLQRTYREQRRNDLGHCCPIHGERAKPQDRAVAAAHFYCCVLCVCLWLCFVCRFDFWLPYR